MPIFLICVWLRPLIYDLVLRMKEIYDLYTLLNFQNFDLSLSTWYYFVSFWTFCWIMPWRWMIIQSTIGIKDIFVHGFIWLNPSEKVKWYTNKLYNLFVLSKFSLNSDYSFWKSSVEMGWTKLFNLLEGTWLLVKMTKIHLNCMLSFFCTRTFFITINTILRFL